MCKYLFLKLPVEDPLLKHAKIADPALQFFLGRFPYVVPEGVQRQTVQTVCCVPDDRHHQLHYRTDGWDGQQSATRRTKMATVFPGSCLRSCLLFSRSPTPTHTVSECFRVHERTAQTRGKVSQMTPWRVCFCWNRDQGDLVQGSTASMNLTVSSRPTTAHWRKLLRGACFWK